MPRLRQLYSVSTVKVAGKEERRSGWGKGAEVLQAAMRIPQGVVMCGLQDDKKKSPPFVPPFDFVEMGGKERRE